MKSATQSGFGARRREIALDEIHRPLGVRLRLCRGHRCPSAHRADEAHLAHQAAPAAARFAQAFAAHLLPDFAWPIHAMVLVVDPTNDRAQHLVAVGPRRASRRIPLLGLVPTVCRRGDRQQHADRLDPMDLAVGIDERHHHVARRLSSAWAQYADALRKISFARFSSRTSRSSSFIRCRSSVVQPARWPVSRSAWRTQRRSVSLVHPSFGAIAAIAAHCDGCSGPCSRTSRTARSRTSGEYRVGRAIRSILSTNGPSDNPGTIHPSDS